MTTAAIDTSLDAGDLAELGYEQQLHRGLGAFAAFASGFSFVSILTTVFQLFALGFSFGGPAFFWTWPLVFIGQFSVALVFAELSARYPISGSIFQWSRRVANEVVGWFAGWLMLIGYIVSVAAIAIALQAVLPAIWSGFQVVGTDSSLSSTDGATNAIIIGSACIAICFVISAVGVKFMARITTIGVSCEIVGVITIVTLLFIHAKRGPSVVTHTDGLGGSGLYLWAFLASMIMACYVMYGFDSAAELSEETNDPRSTAPRAIIRAMVVSFVGGGLMLIAGLMAAGTIDAPQLSTQGLSWVVTDRLGNTVGKILLADVAISIFSAALAISASASRVTFSMARDGALPFAKQLSRVSERTGTPIIPSLAVNGLAIAVLVVNLGQAELFAAVTSVSVVLVYSAYLLVTVPSLMRRLKDPDGYAAGSAGHFSLGRWGLPLNIVAVVFGAFLLLDIGWPRAAVYDPSGKGWYLHYFSLLFLGIALAAGAASYSRIRMRTTPVPGRGSVPAQRQAPASEVVAD